MWNEITTRDTNVKRKRERERLSRNQIESDKFISEEDKSEMNALSNSNSTVCVCASVRRRPRSEEVCMPVVRIKYQTIYTFERRHGTDRKIKKYIYV